MYSETLTAFLGTVCLLGNHSNSKVRRAEDVGINNLFLDSHVQWHAHVSFRGAKLYLLKHCLYLLKIIR